MTNIEDRENCPKCGESWVGKEIPKENRSFFNGATNFSLLVGIETEGYDGVSVWMCPFCKGRWDRFEEIFGAGSKPSKVIENEK